MQILRPQANCSLELSLHAYEAPKSPTSITIPTINGQLKLSFKSKKSSDITILYWMLCLFYFDEANTESELAMGIIKGLRMRLKILDGILIPYYRQEIYSWIRLEG